MKVYISRPDYTERERAAIRAFAEPGVTQFAQGPEVAAFEREFSSYIGQSEGIAVNSGSSANLLLFAALIELGHLQKGDEVIVPATTFATVVSPLYQLGLVPLYVDIEQESFNIDPQRIVEAIGERTRAIFVVHTLGYPAAMDEICEIAEQNNLLLLEDCCEAHGATSDGRRVGSFSLASTFSFFVAHNMTTGEGGMVATSDEALARMLRSTREFGRWQGDRWGSEDQHFAGYDGRYIFERLGYNVRMLEISAAIGRVQLDRLTEMNERRHQIAAVYLREFGFESEPAEGHVYYGFGLTHRNRDAIVRKLDERGIETRPLFAGALHLQPGYRDLTHRISSARVAEWAKDEGFFIPCHSALTDDEVEYVAREVKELLG